uniref:Uncharacterized protein n=1 Tax=Oryza barthii TaxID=65489 RepID=A0A0D3GPD1_9ORYZ
MAGYGGSGAGVGATAVGSEGGAGVGAVTRKPRRAVVTPAQMCLEQLLSLLRGGVSRLDRGGSWLTREALATPSSPDSPFGKNDEEASRWWDGGGMGQLLGVAAGNNKCGSQPVVGDR